MSENKPDFDDGLLLDLFALFSPARSINTAQVRKYLGISACTAWRMKKAGRYPKITYVSSKERVMLVDLAVFLREVCSSSGSPLKKRGRPVGSRNRAKLNCSQPTSSATQ